MMRSRLNPMVLACLLCVMSTGGCLFFKTDICNTMPTFKAMEAGDRLAALGETAALTVKFSPGQKMPVAYYRAAVLSRAGQDPYGEPWDNHFAVLEGFVAGTDALVLRLLTSSLQSDA